MIEAYDESTDHNVSLGYVGVAKLFILFGILGYKDGTLDNDGWAPLLWASPAWSSGKTATCAAKRVHPFSW